MTKNCIYFKSILSSNRGCYKIKEMLVSNGPSLCDIKNGFNPPY